MFHLTCPKNNILFCFSCCYYIERILEVHNTARTHSSTHIDNNVARTAYKVDLSEMKMPSQCRGSKSIFPLHSIHPFAHPYFWVNLILCLFARTHTLTQRYLFLLPRFSSLFSTSVFLVYTARAASRQRAVSMGARILMKARSEGKHS